MHPRCLPFYSPENAYRVAYNLPGWIPMPNISAFHSEFELHGICPKPWRYQDSTTSQALPFQGQTTTYDGGGYIADLGYNVRSALEIISHLEEWNWVDDRTAAVITEFTVFEPSTSLFSAAKLLFEKLPTGGVLLTVRIETLALYASADPGKRFLYQMSQLLIMIYLLYYISAEIAKLWRGKSAYFLDIWNWFEMFQIGAVIAALVLFFVKEKYTSRFVINVKENPFQSSGTDTLVDWYNLETFVLSLVVFTVTVKLLRVIRFNHHIANISATLKLSTSNIASFLIVFFIVILSFNQLGVLLFSSDIVSYSSFGRSFITLLLITFGGDFNFEKVRGSPLGSVFICTYTFVSVMVLCNIFMALLILCYKDVVHQKGRVTVDEEVGHFMSQYFTARLANICKYLLGPFTKLGTRKNGSKLNAAFAGYINLSKTHIEITTCARDEIPLQSGNMDRMAFEEDPPSTRDSKWDIWTSDYIPECYTIDGVIWNVQSRNMVKMFDRLDELEHRMVVEEFEKCFTESSKELRKLLLTLKDFPRSPKRKVGQLRSVCRPRRRKPCSCKPNYEAQRATEEDANMVFQGFWKILEYIWEYFEDGEPASNQATEDNESLLSHFF